MLSRIYTAIFLIFFFNASVIAEPLIYNAEKNILVIVGKYSTIWYKSLIEPNATWHKAKGLSGSAHFNSVIAAGGKFIAIADQSTIWYSTDGIYWQPAKGLTGSAKLNAILYTGTQYIAVGNVGYDFTGFIWTSKDGEHWVNRAKKLNSLDLRAIAYDGKNTIVAVGALSSYLVSQDNGRTFRSGYIGGTADLHDIIFHQGQFIAVGGYSTIYSSTDGIHWTAGHFKSPIPSTSLNKIIFSTKENAYVVIGDSGKFQNYDYPTIFGSRDGKHWSFKKVKTINRKNISLSLAAIAADNTGIYLGGYHLNLIKPRVVNLLYYLPNWGFAPALTHVSFTHKDILPYGKLFTASDIASIVSLGNGKLYAISYQALFHHNEITVYTSEPYTENGKTYNGLVWKQDTVLN